MRSKSSINYNMVSRKTSISHEIPIRTPLFIASNSTASSSQLSIGQFSLENSDHKNLHTKAETYAYRAKWPGFSLNISENWKSNKGPRYLTAIPIAAISVMLRATGAAVAQSSDYDKYRDSFSPIPALPPIPADNSLTKERVELGRQLYWDRRTSKTGATSCGFCHHPSCYGTDPIDRLVGVFGEITLPTHIQS